MNAAASMTTSTPARPGRHPVARILLGSWQQSWNRQERWGLWLLPVVPLLPAGLMFLHVGLGLAVLCVLLLMMVAGTWATTLGNVLEQNQPSAARLVPGHVRRLRLALAVGAALAIAVAVALLEGLLASLQLSAAGRAMEVTGAMLLPIATSLAALTVITTALVVRWPTLGYLAFLFPFGALFERGSWFAAAAVATVSLWRAMPGSASALFVLAALLLPGALLQSGGAGHERGYALRRHARERFRLRALGLEPGVAQQDGWAAALFRFRISAYQRWFARLLARPSSPMGRLQLGLGPTGHWTTLLASILNMTVMSAIVLTGLAIFGPSDLPVDIAGGLSIGLMAMAATPMFQVRARFHQSRAEQGLLTLLPGMPRGAALARGLALHATFEFVVGWIVLFAFTRLDVALLSGMDRQVSALVTSSGIVAVAVLPMVALAWRRLDRLTAPSQAAIMGELLLLVVLSGAVFTVHRFAGVPLPAIGGAVALATAAWCAWRWRRMAGEPAPLPTGR
jgi:hypothetical protein